MALTVTSIDELSADDVEAIQAELSQMIQEKYPEVELTRGVIHDIVQFFGAINTAINRTEVNRVLESRSLLALETAPQLADDELVDHLLSNYLITRKTGERAAGDITIVVEGDSAVVIGAGAAYTANGVEFQVDAPITALPTGSTTTNVNDRVLTDRGDGSYEFTVPATAVEVGEEGNIQSGSRFTPSPEPPRYVTSYATADFTGGISTESNTELVERMQTGIPAKVAAGRLNITSLVKDQAVFADIKHLSIVGYGDPEMTRDQHWVFPVSGGGRTDVYAHNDSLPQTVKLNVTASLVEKRGADSIWQFTLDRDALPGFYDVRTVRRAEDAVDVDGFEVTYDVRGWDFDDDTWNPDLETTIESAFSRYQTAVIQFADTLTDVTDMTVGDTATYVADVRAQPLIREMQEFLSGADYRPLGSDILVKAAVPCFLSINCDIIKESTESAPLLDDIRAAVANYVNNLNFPGTLYASQILDVIHDHLTGTQAVGPLDMHGVILRPDGDTVVVRDSQVLALPDSPSTLVTPNTTAFILYAEDVGLSVVNRSN